MTAPDFDRIAAELYTLDPADFTAARNRHADRLRTTDRQLAKRIRALHRPTRAAWAANLLAHRHPDVVGELLDLGAALRDAQEHLAGERLRELVERRRPLVRALTSRAVKDAAAAGHPLAAGTVADLDATFSAALADPDAARALAAGRLTATLQPVAWPGTAGAAPKGDHPAQAPSGPAGTHATASSTARTPRSTPRHRSSNAAAASARAKAATEQHRRDVERAQAALEAARQERAAALARAEAAEQALGEARAEQREAQARAGRARAALDEAHRSAAQAREDVSRTEEDVRAARRRARSAGTEAERTVEALRRATDRVRELAGGGDRPQDR
ncbi:hypothetical protein ACIPYS_21335 [Kitasatospora sp. NPDC089913]|uniref:hypothetical protein n=1 Tax=Kitasatospora sp. NPDC089913 TaxID=3364080 RepID=UPI00382F96E1